MPVRGQSIPFKPKGPRPFDPTSEAASKSLQEHIESGIHISDAARKHHRKKLEDPATRRKRIQTLNTSFSKHDNQKQGPSAGDSPKITVLYGLKKQELDLLQAFDRGAVGEKDALYKLLENGFVQKMVSGPAFHRAGLEEADQAAVEKFVKECLEEFHRENAGS